jgi:hypothetical protein
LGRDVLASGVDNIHQLFACFELGRLSLNITWGDYIRAWGGGPTVLLLTSPLGCPVLVGI